MRRISTGLVRLWWRYTVPLMVRANGLELGKVTFLGAPIITITPGSNITISDRVVMTSKSEFTALGVSRPCIIRTLRPAARIVIGEDTGLSGVVICAACSVVIGERCLLGADVTIMDNDFHPLDHSGRRYCADVTRIKASPIEIGDNVFIGTGALILKGVKIGANSVIGARAVVVSDIPANVVATGSPAAVVRELHE